MQKMTVQIEMMLFYNLLETLIPMVSVQYNNTGLGFGRSSNEAFLPYRIIKDGAFRPPIVDLRDLMPLSRQPRNTTSINTSAEFIDFSKASNQSENALKA